MKGIHKQIILVSSFLLLASAFIIVANLYARPQYSVMRSMGTKCTACHINANYGGQRNFAGWLSSTSIGLVDPSDIGIGGAYNFMTNTNSVWDDRIMFGMDVRFQNAKWAQTAGLTRGRDEEGNLRAEPEFERKFMTMQLMPYLQVKATDWLSFDGGYNLGYDIHDDMRYPGQQPGYASAKFKFSDELPSLRVGYFAPSIGIDYDDHTVLVRMVAGLGRSQPLVPADYFEYGAELNYDGISWMNASLGVFDSQTMSQLQAGGGMPVVNGNSLSTVANLSFHPTLPYGLNAFFGVSHFVNGGLGTDDGIYIENDYYYITSMYLNVGLSDRLALMTEYITSEKQNIRKADNFLVELNYQLFEALNVFARFEDARSEYMMDGTEFNANQYVLGAHIFPLPYIDILPEYRIYDRADMPDFSAQWAIQVHIFY
jgi:hypothetical protein